MKRKLTNDEVLTRSEIRAKILAGESFWVSSRSERAQCITVSKEEGMDYKTSAVSPVGKFGYNICRVNPVKKTK